MPRPALSAIALLTLLAAPSLADVTGSGFDGMPPGPYTGPAPVLEGNPANVLVDQVGGGSPHSAPIPPGASGNVLCIDAVDKASRVVVQFTFACDLIPNGVCQLEYDYSVAQYFGSGVEVHVDAGGDYSNPDDVINLPIGLPPSTTAGDNTETEGACDLSSHTVAFVVYPGSVLCIDNLVTECLQPTEARRARWGTLKLRYR